MQRHDQTQDGTKPDRHGHAPRSSDERALAMSLALVVSFMVAEVAVAVVSHSVALFADAGHMLTDGAALAAAIVAARLAARPAHGVWTYGLKRAEILAAAGNGVALVVVAALVSFGAVTRLIHPVKVAGTDMLAVALAGVVVNLLATSILARANRTSLNVEGAFRHVATDLAAFIATAAAAVAIIVTDFRRADPIASLFVVALLLVAAYGLLRESGRVLLEAAPANVALDEVRLHMLGVPHVAEVHDLHVWTLTSNLPALSAHVVVEECCFAENHAPRVLDELQACLVGHFDVEHSTFQLEDAGHLDHESGAHP